MPPPQRWQGPGALPRERRGRSGAWPDRAGPRQALASPGRPSARRRKPTQDPPAPTRVGGAEGAPAPAVPLLWPPSAGALAAPDHPLRGWPVQGQSEHGEDRAARRKTGERSRSPRAACREARKTGSQAPLARRLTAATGSGPPALGRPRALPPAWARAGPVWLAPTDAGAPGRRRCLAGPCRAAPGTGPAPAALWGGERRGLATAGAVTFGPARPWARSSGLAMLGPLLGPRQGATGARENPRGGAQEGRGMRQNRRRASIRASRRPKGEKGRSGLN